MNRLAKSFTNYLTSHNSWIVIVALAYFTFKYILNVVVPGEGTEYFAMVYLHPQKWILFFKMLAVSLMLLSPIILLTHFRPYLKRSLSKPIYWVLSVIVLIGLPALLMSSRFFTDKLPTDVMPEVFGMVGFLISAISIFTEPSGWLVSRLSFSNLSKILTPTRIVLGLLFCLSLYGTIQLKMIHREEAPFLLLWLQNLLVMSVYFAFFKINHEYLIKQIFKSKGVVYYYFSFLGLMMLFYLPMALIYYYLPGFRSLLSYKVSADWVGEAPQAFWAIYSTTITAYMFLTIPLAILVEWFTQENEIDKLQGEKSETELNLLKQQINPHFFFNTLNNVYAMSLTNDKNTSEGILQLSDLMRYVIYKGQEETVSLADEMKYLEDFLDLQKLRLHKNLDLSFEKTMIDENTRITPLLFIILVENAFKHGIEGSEEESYLHLHLWQDKNKLKFSCKNSVEPGRAKVAPGLGLNNLRRRLELLYPDKHSLSIKEFPDSYRAVLTIDL